jgi:Putative beta-barrel porin 2
MSLKRSPLGNYAIAKQVALIFLLLCTQLAHADWRAKLGTNSYFTDDVALFSVSRRFSLKDDPTQPSVDHPQQGSDFVFEPYAEIEWTGKNNWGELLVSLDAAGYLFSQKTEYSHGLYELEISQKLPTDTTIRFEYNWIPELFIDKNKFIQPNHNATENDETLSSHFWGLQLDQALTDNLTLRLLSRYGLRNYDHPFEHRDTEFWTLGPHIEWQITPVADLLVGYHYEQGTAKPWVAVGYADDVSYINHYASAELKLRLLEKLTANFIFDYEKVSFTSTNAEDEHYLAEENGYQGEIELLYELSQNVAIAAGWQHGQRKLNIEPQAIKNNNLWLGVEYTF